MVVRTYYFRTTVFDLLLLHLKAVTILFCENIIGLQSYIYHIFTVKWNVNIWNDIVTIGCQ